MNACVALRQALIRCASLTLGGALFINTGCSLLTLVCEHAAASFLLRPKISCKNGDHKRVHIILGVLVYECCAGKRAIRRLAAPIAATLQATRPSSPTLQFKSMVCFMQPPRNSNYKLSCYLQKRSSPARWIDWLRRKTDATLIFPIVAGQISIAFHD